MSERFKLGDIFAISKITRETSFLKINELVSIKESTHPRRVVLVDRLNPLNNKKLHTTLVNVLFSSLTKVDDILGDMARICIDNDIEESVQFLNALDAFPENFHEEEAEVITMFINLPDFENNLIYLFPEEDVNDLKDLKKHILEYTKCI